MENVDYLVANGAKLYYDSLTIYPHPFLIAIYKGNIEMISYLINHGIDVNSKFTEGYGDCLPCPENVTALHMISYISRYFSVPNWEEMIDLLVDNGADINALGHTGYTPLEFAVFANNYNIVNKLIKLGANLESNNFSAIHAAAMFSDSRMVELLLNLGADPNSLDENKNTPLHRSFICCSDGLGGGIITSERTKTFEILYNRGADIYIKNSEGLSIVDFCKKGYNLQIGALLVRDSILDWEDIKVWNYPSFNFKKIVTSDEEAVIRSHPSIHAPILRQLNLYDTLMTRNENFGDSIIIAEFKGNFDLVQKDDVTGFVFNGILRNN
ncbi:hypothetical protein ES708_17693 [subsurface metagenome]